MTQRNTYNNVLLWRCANIIHANAISKYHSFDIHYVNKIHIRLRYTCFASIRVLKAGHICNAQQRQMSLLNLSNIISPSNGECHMPNETHRMSSFRSASQSAHRVELTHSLFVNSKAMNAAISAAPLCRRSRAHLWTVFITFSLHSAAAAANSQPIRTLNKVWIDYVYYVLIAHSNICVSVTHHGRRATGPGVFDATTNNHTYTTNMREWESTLPLCVRIKLKCDSGWQSAHSHKTRDAWESCSHK